MLLQIECQKSSKLFCIVSTYDDKKNTSPAQMLLFTVRRAVNLYYLESVTICTYKYAFRGRPFLQTRCRETCMTCTTVCCYKL